MRFMLLGLLATLCICKPAKAEFELFFDEPLYSLTPGDSTMVDLILRETGTNNFTNGLNGVALTVRLSNPTLAQFTAVDFNNQLINGDGINTPTAEFTFIRNTPFTGILGMGGEARIATFTVQTYGNVVSLLEIDYHTTDGQAELTFGGTGIDFNTLASTDFSFTSSTITAVPEPTSLALVGLAGAGAFCNRRVRGMLRRKKQTA